MIKNLIARLMLVMGGSFLLSAPMMAAPKWIDKQGKGIFLFNVAIVLAIVGFAGYIWWKKRNGDGGGDE